jgi:hypothetical protein
VYLLVSNLIVMAISLLTAFLVPGPGGLALWMDEAVRLRLMKYDYLEENPPEAGTRKRAKIPWDALLIDDRERTGSRTIKNLIFPWKD